MINKMTLQERERAYHQELKHRVFNTNGDQFGRLARDIFIDHVMAAQQEIIDEVEAIFSSQNGLPKFFKAIEAWRRKYGYDKSSDNGQG